MLAGVLLPLCLAPVQAVAEVPLLAVSGRGRVGGGRPVRPAVGGAGRTGRRGRRASSSTGPGWVRPNLTPALVWTAPRFDPATLVGVGLPLFLVTMASQNVPGMAVLATYGYRPAWPRSSVATGLGTLAAAPLRRARGEPGGDQRRARRRARRGPRPGRRWIASVTAGVGLAALGLGAGLATALILLSPPVLVSAVAGLALLGALAAALASAVADPAARESAAVTFVVTAAGIAFLGIGAAFWGLLAGGAMALLHRRRAPREEPLRRPPSRG